MNMLPPNPARYVSADALGVARVGSAVASGRGHSLTFPAALLVLYCVLAFYRIGHQSLWIDEVRSLESAAPQESVWSPDLWLRGQGPLYFVLLHFWAKVSTSEAYLRSLSVVAGAGAIVLIYALARQLFNRAVARSASLLLAASPFFIWYSQEVRYVMFMMATALFATYALQRSISTDLPRWWSVYSMSLVVAWAAGVANILMPVAHGISILGTRTRYSAVWRTWLRCQVPLIVIVAWWANGGAVTRLDGDLQLVANAIAAGSNTLAVPNERVFGGTTREVTFTALPYTFYAFSTGFSVGPTLRELHLSPSPTTVAAYVPVMLTAAVIFGSLFVYGILALWRDRQARQLLLPWLAVPTVGAFALSIATSMDYNVRYAAMALPAYCLILAIGLAECGRTRLRTIAAAAVFGFNAYALANYYFNPHYARDDARAAAQYLAAVSRPGDVILLVGNDITLRYYYSGTVPLTTWYGTTETGAATVAYDICGLHEDYPTVWLVSTRGWETDPHGLVTRALDRLYRKHAHAQFPGVEIIGYERPPADGATRGCVSQLTKELS